MGIIRCAVTGALGNVGYNLIFFLAQGKVFGPHQKISLHLLEIGELSTQLQGIKMELEDCAFPVIHEIKIGTDPYEMFGDIDCAFLVGAKPRGPGMERKDLLQANGKIFSHQGCALNAVAKKDVRVLVVGNPCNTNCLIALHNAPNLSAQHFAAMTRLDENRARAILAVKTQTPIEGVSPVVIWGNHSSTLVPDATSTLVDGKRVIDCVSAGWLQSTFLSQVRQRGAEIIKVRGKSSAASAAWAAVETMKAFYGEPEENKLFSLATFSEKNPYGIDDDLVFSFPCRMRNGNLDVDSTQKPGEELWNEVKISEQELKAEKEMVSELLGKKGSQTAA